MAEVDEVLASFASNPLFLMRSPHSPPVTPGSASTRPCLTSTNAILTRTRSSTTIDATIYPCSQRGAPLSDFKDDINARDYIFEYCSGGPKNYGYQMHRGKVISKVRGCVIELLCLPSKHRYGLSIKHANHEHLCLKIINKTMVLYCF